MKLLIVASLPYGMFCKLDSEHGIVIGFREMTIRRVYDFVAYLKFCLRFGTQTFEIHCVSGHFHCVFYAEKALIYASVSIVCKVSLNIV